MENLMMQTKEQRPKILTNYTENIQAQAKDAEARIAVSVESQRATAAIQGAMAIAKRFPRDTDSAMERILNSCRRTSFAQTALYSYTRGGQDVTGPSIRLAETLAINWGNLEYGIKELENKGGMSTMEAACLDLESNTRIFKVFQVKHERHTKKGTTRLEDSRDIYELLANNGSRRLRACILAMIPSDVVELAVDTCEDTLKRKEDISPDTIRQIISKFVAIGVTKPQLEQRIGCKMENISPEQVITLRKIYNSLKDRISCANDWFKIEQGQEQEPKRGDLLSVLKENTVAAEEVPNADQ